MNKVFLALLCLSASVSMSVCGAEAVQYRIHDLGTFGGVSSCARSINNLNQVVGYSETSCDYNNNKPHAFLWDNNNGMQDLGASSGSESYAFDINDKGQVVGYYRYYNAYNGYYYSDGFLWQNGHMERLYSGEAYGINNNGVIVGAGNYSGWIHAVQFQNSSLECLPLSSAHSYANAINDYGDIVGSSEQGSRAFLVQNGALQNLSVLPYDSNSIFNAINNYCQVVGTIGGSSFLYQNGSLQYIGGLPGDSRSEGFGINNNGQIVGISYGNHRIGQASISGSLAFIWNNGVTQSLDSLPGDLFSRAYGINDNGWIVGSSQAANGEVHACVWEPVPEPSSILSLLCGIGGLSAVIRRKTSK